MMTEGLAVMDAEHLGVIVEDLGVMAEHPGVIVEDLVTEQLTVV